MLRSNVIFASALAALLVFGGIARAGSVRATLMDVAGDVQVQREEGAKWRDARDGTRLSDGYTVKTGDDGKAVITWGLGNVVKVYPLTSIAVDELEADAATGDAASDLSLGHGRVMAQVGKLASRNSHFNIKTPTAVAGVRGTSFDLDMPEGSDELSVSVLEGSVSLEAGGVEIMLGAGFESIVVMGEIPGAPMAIPAAAFADMKEAAAELKDISEKTGGGKSKKEEDAGTDSIEAVTDSVTEAVTIMLQTLEVPSGCPGGGGCIEGTVTVKDPTQ